MYLLGFDIGSSSIKAALVEVSTGRTLGIAQHPETEMAIISKHADWAEQDPELWWKHTCKATLKLLDKAGVDPKQIRAIGIAYQMHGLVLIDQDHQVLRPSIIWCDSRAVDIGHQAFQEIGEQTCLEHFLNSPGNFTASKLKWVKDHEPATYARIHKILLPGDFIALKLTGEARTTVSGLSEGILWDFKEKDLAHLLLDYYGIDPDVIPEVLPTFSIHGKLSREAAEATGLAPGIPVAYRAGDQPNNALALNILNPGEVAATGGTSGVVYAVTDRPEYDLRSRVNGFAHVNYERAHPRIGVLMCVNGAGIQYSWMKHQVAKEGTSYQAMEEMAASAPVGAEELTVIPFGNGAERILENRSIGSHMVNLQLNRHTRAHLFRAALEGIAFAFVYGIDILKEMGLDMTVIRVGNDNLFQSPAFSHTIATLVGCRIEVLETTGAVGAAKGAGFGAGVYHSLEEAMRGITQYGSFEPQPAIEKYQQAYQRWQKALNKIIKETNLIYE